MCCSCLTEEDRKIVLCDDERGMFTEMCNHYRQIGRQDSIAAIARPYFKKCVSHDDTLGIITSGTALAQAYVLMDINHDSTLLLLDRLEPYVMSYVDSNIHIKGIYYTTRGHAALKYSLDYSTALNSYLKAYEYALQKKLYTSVVVALYNIVNIFYIQNDKNGMHYARMALEASQNENIDNFHKVAAYVSMTQMSLLSSQYSEAQQWLAKAHSLLKTGSIPYWDPVVNLLSGDILSARGDYSNAFRFYDMALSDSYKAEPSLVSKIYLSYGDACQKAGNPDRAIELYNTGIHLSKITNNLEFREDLMARIATLLYETGRQQLSARYYRQLYAFVDSLFLDAKEQALSKALLQYTEARHDLMSARQELVLSEMRRKYFTSIILVFAVGGIAVIAMILYVKQKKFNSESVSRYLEYNKRLSSEGIKQEALKKHEVLSDIHQKLYLRMEELMSSGAYRDKGLSLEKMAEMLASNRTYVSNAVNMIAGTSFNEYVNSYRIKEATRILSDPALSSAINTKQLADKVGFNNTQVFYSVFKKETGVTPGVFKNEVLKSSGASPS